MLKNRVFENWGDVIVQSDQVGHLEFTLGGIQDKVQLLPEPIKKEEASLKLAKLLCAASIRGADGRADDINSTLREFVFSAYSKAPSMSSIVGYVYIELLDHFDNSTELPSPFNKFSPPISLGQVLDVLSTEVGNLGFPFDELCEARVNTKLNAYTAHEDPDIAEKAWDLKRIIHHGE